MCEMRILKLLVAALLLSLSVSLSAQESNRDENGKIVRGPYLTNRFVDNWFISIGGGVNFFGDGGYKPAMGANLDANVGKWFLPSIAARVGYTGLTGSMWSETPSIFGPELDADKGMYKQRFGFAYLHADALWDVFNTFGGYKERVWDLIPYAHTGAIMTYNRASGEKFVDSREFASGLGLLNNFRLHERVDLTLDLRAFITGGKHHLAKDGISAALQASFGVSVNLGKTGWTRASNWHNPVDTDKIAAVEASAAALAAVNENLEAEKTDLKKKNEALEEEVVELEKKVAEKKTVLEDVGPTSVYFEIGKTTLSQKELQHLDYYLKTILPCIGEDKVTVLTGTADSSTGTMKRNQYLCEKRVEYVLDLLSKNYGLERDKFLVKTQIVDDGSAALHRAVVISFE